jgi:hypothetical protein
MMYVNRWIITCTIILFAAACGISNSDNPNNPDNWPVWDDHNPPPAELLKMELVEVPDVIEQGRTVEFAMEVTNTSEQNYILIARGPFRDSGYYDFLVTGEENKLYWSYYLPGMEKINGMEVWRSKFDGTAGVPLKAGESVELRMEWDGKDIHERTIEPGRYEVTGLYEIGWIWDEELNTILDNEVGHYTTEPKAFVIE